MNAPHISLPASPALVVPWATSMTGDSVDPAIETIQARFEAAKLDRFCLVTPDDNATISHIGIGRPDASNHVISITGFGVAQECMLDSLLMAALQIPDDPHQAFRSLALIGPSTAVRKGIALTPERLVEIYLSSILQLIQGRSPQGRLTIAGNSMGAMIALGVVLALFENYGIRANCVLDNPMSWNIISHHEPHLLTAPLHKTLATIQPLGETALRAGIWTALGNHIIGDVVGRRILLNSLYGVRGQQHILSPVLPEMHAYYNALVRMPASPENCTVADVMVSMAAHIHGWEKYLAGFRDVLTTPDGKIINIQLPGRAVISRSLGDMVLDGDIAEGLQRVLKTSRGGIRPEIRHFRNQPHCERPGGARIYQVSMPLGDTDIRILN